MRSKFWGRFNVPVLVLLSEEDEYVPAHVNQLALLKKYQRCNAYVSELSGYIPDANHAVVLPDSQKWLAKTVVKFLQDVA